MNQFRSNYIKQNLLLKDLVSLSVLNVELLVSGHPFFNLLVLKNIANIKNKSLDFFSI